MPNENVKDRNNHRIANGTCGRAGQTCLLTTTCRHTRNPQLVIFICPLCHLGLHWFTRWCRTSHGTKFTSTTPAFLGHYRRLTGHSANVACITRWEMSSTVHIWPVSSTWQLLWMRNKPSWPEEEVPLQTFPASWPLEFVTMDILGSLPKTTTGSELIVVIADWYTKLTREILLSNPLHHGLLLSSSTKAAYHTRFTLLCSLTMAHSSWESSSRRYVRS